MSQTLLATKKRIQSIESTKKITKAMNLVSTVKLKSQMKRLSESNNYAEQIEKVVQKVFNTLDDFESPYCVKNDVNKRLFIIVTSSLGLCGSYNFNVFKLIDSTLTQDDEAIIIGNKGIAHYSLSKFQKNKEFIGIDPSDINHLATFFKQYLMNIYPQGLYKSINFIYTKYKNSITFEPKIKQILPVLFKNGKKDKYEAEPLIEPNRSKVVESLIPVYLESIILSILLDSNVSEQASRRNAMDNATNNAQDLVEQLKLEYNKARQNSITSEIIEVVSASNNLQGGN